MTWKAGDSVAIPVFFETNAGVAQVYANAAAFTGAGGLFTWYGAGAAIATPTYTLTPLGATGWHWLAFTLPLGVDTIIPTYPAGIRSDPGAYVLVTPGDDTDSLAAKVASTTGTPVAGSTFSSYDVASVEGDGFSYEFTIPAAALQVFDATLGKYLFTDLSDVGGTAWTVAAQARGPWAAGQLPANAVAFSYSAVISDKANRKVALGWATSPAGAIVVKNEDGSADTTGAVPQTIYLFDIQLVPPTASPYYAAGKKITGVVGTHTIRRQQTTSP